MSNGRLSKAGIVAVVALVSVNLVACDPGATSHGEKRVSVRLHPEPDTLRAAMRPHAVRAQLHAASGRLWALHADGVDVHDARSAGTTTSIDLPGWSWAAAPWACPPDLTLVGNRDVLVTSNVSAAIWRIDSATLEATRHDLAVAESAGRDVGFSRVLYSARNDALLAAGAIDNSLWRIDRSLTQAQPIELSPSLPHGCVLSVVPGNTDNVFCMQIEHGDWIVTLSADLRSGEVHSGKCSSRKPRVDIDVEVPRACPDGPAGCEITATLHRAPGANSRGLRHSPSGFAHRGMQS